MYNSVRSASSTINISKIKSALYLLAAYLLLNRQKQGKTKSATLTSKILSDKNTDINKYINNKRGTLGSWITSLITKWVPLKRPFSYSQKTLQGSSLDSRLTPRPKPTFTFPKKKTKAFATLERALEPKCVPQLFLGSLLWTRWSSVSHFFYLSLVTIPEVFAKVNSTQFPSRF